MKPILQYGGYYHIFNQGNNREDIFMNNEDYQHFLDKLDVYIGTVADIYAWALLRNHFHLLVRIKEEGEIGYFNSEHAKSDNPYLKWNTYFPDLPDKRFKIKPKPTEQFKHFFNAYSRWFNKRHGRVGALFQKNYDRKEVSCERYFINLIIYIHTNPIKHGFVENILDYPWTSYLLIKTEKVNFIKKREVVNYFDGIDNYIATHNLSIERIEERIKDLIIE